MNKNLRFVRLVSALVFACAVIWLRPTPAGDEWQPISQEDLALKDNPASPGAHAMILYREDVINAKAAWDDEYMRIKIFTPEGVKDLADVSIPFNPSQGRIQLVRARTIQPDGKIENFDGKVFEKTIVKASGLKILAKTFSLPDVKPGCIIEYKYRTQRDTQYVSRGRCKRTISRDWADFRLSRIPTTVCRRSTSGCWVWETRRRNGSRTGR